MNAKSRLIANDMQQRAMPNDSCRSAATIANVYAMYRLNLVSRRYLDLGRVSSQMCMGSAMYEMPRHSR